MLARAEGIAQYYLPPARSFTNGNSHPAFTVSIHKMAPSQKEVADIWLQLTTQLSTLKTWKVELAWLVDL